MTRIVWELNEVVEGKGGTALMPGSHQANHVRPNMLSVFGMKPNRRTMCGPKC